MFDDNLRIELKLTIGSTSYEIPGAQVKNFEIELNNYGFNAWLDFWVTELYETDSMLTPFTGKDMITVLLKILATDVTGSSPDPIVIQGIVTKKSLYEVMVQGDTESIFRRYTVHFTDAAHLLWSQHYPLNLYADMTLEDVIKRQTCKGISLQMDWTLLTETHSIICLSMGHEKSEASFYDFLMWLIETNNGVWEYDATNNMYKICGEKTTNTLFTYFDSAEVDKLEYIFPETPRHNIRILNSYAESAKKEETENEQGQEGVYREFHMRSSVTSDLTDRNTLEASCLKLREKEIKVTFGKFPKSTFLIGKYYQFGEMWQSIFANKTTAQNYRIYQIKISAHAKDQTGQQGLDETINAYDIDMTSMLEIADETHVKLPEYKKPYYPIFAEGKMECTEGEINDRTYQYIEDSDTSLHYYQVIVPIWNQTIIAPYNPNLIPGHMYFPIYKYSRLLLELHFHHAEINRMLDWGTDVRLTQESQGNHILFGKNSASETTMRHYYEDDKPLLHIKRTSDTDTQLVQMIEGGIIIQTQEEEASTTTTESIDVTPRADLAQGEMNMETEGAISSFSADSAATKAGVTSHLGSSSSEVKNELDNMESGISSKSDEVQSQLTEAASGLGDKSSQMKSQLASLKSELESKK